MVRAARVFTRYKLSENHIAAYGIAGITRGLGLRSHEQIRLLALLADWLDSKNKQHREAGCILFATMCV